MDEARLKKIGAELEKARARKDEWEAKVRILEQKYKEAEKTCVHQVMQAANMTPEQVAEVIRWAKAGNMDYFSHGRKESSDEEEVFTDEE